MRISTNSRRALRLSALALALSAAYAMADQKDSRQSQSQSRIAVAPDLPPVSMYEPPLTCERPFYFKKDAALAAYSFFGHSVFFTFPETHHLRIERITARLISPGASSLQIGLVSGNQFIPRAEVPVKHKTARYTAAANGAVYLPRSSIGWLYIEPSTPGQDLEVALSLAGCLVDAIPAQAMLRPEILVPHLPRKLPLDNPLQPQQIGAPAHP